MTSPMETVRLSLDDLVMKRVIRRIWHKDASLWPEQSAGAEPAAEIMGWLELPKTLQDARPQLVEPAADLRGRGITDAVVMGMGGSSMTPEVLRVVFGRMPDGMRMHVLDTVNPGTIGPLTESLDLPHTAFIVASKSGTTVEPLSLEKHFRAALARAGVANPADNFVAISDAGTPLAKRAAAGEFAHWIETPRDVGGRFSALTAFGMFPATLQGLDIYRIQQAAERMAELCNLLSTENPGLQLGSALGVMASMGRDKVTLITSPRLERFGLWVEQLLAESTGKHGNGLIPIVNEPLMEVNQYGTDRNFVYMRLKTEDNDKTDELANALIDAGHPVAHIEIDDLYDLGAEFFRWEFATAVAGHVLGIFPFDQPDVNAAKDKAREILNSGHLPESGSAGSVGGALTDLLKSPRPGDYVAIGAFMPESEEATAAFARLRSAITRGTGMATTFGYGPRYLHSIGQLYKGGPKSIRFLGLVSHGSGELPVPGESYTLGALTPAQAYGDFEVMRERGRRIQTAVLGNNPVAEIERLAAELE